MIVLGAVLRTNRMGVCVCVSVDRYGYRRRLRYRYISRGLFSGIGVPDCGGWQVRNPQGGLETQRRAWGSEGHLLAELPLPQGTSVFFL